MSLKRSDLNSDICILIFLLSICVTCFVCVCVFSGVLICFM